MTALLDGRCASLVAPGATTRAPEQAPLRVRALGHLELLAPAGAVAPGPRGQALTGRPRAALAALLVRVGRVVSADSLTEAVWGARRPVHAEAALQTVLSRLRAHLRSAGLDGALLTRQPGYLLRLDPDAFDVTRFRALAARGRAALPRDPGAAEEVLREAVGLWHGAAYAEFADAEFAAVEVAGLEEARHGAVEDLAEALLALGRPEEAVPLLETVIAEAPTRERPHAGLMLALYRTGRQTDALAAYRRHRLLLAEQLGLHPSAALRALETRILRHDPALAPRSSGARLEVVVPARPPSGGPVGNIPANRASLVGADGTLRQVRAALATGRVVTLTGPGGVGKTRVATAAAQEAAGTGRFPDGAWLVGLAALGCSSPVADAVLAELPADPGGPQGAGGLVERLRGKRLLLVLDDCEHLVAAVATLAQSLAEACPGVTVLATSRVPLGIEAERIVPVPPLSLPARRGEPGAAEPSDAVRLFLERARALVPSFAAEGAAMEAVAELCRRLDGIPLAIELAAGRMRFMTPAEVVRHLPDRFHRMRNPYRLAADRHQDLQAVVDWSYRLLEPADQRLFEDLSVFSTPFGVEDVAAVRGVDALDAVERVSALVDRSMVVADVDVATGTTRYRLLETLRSFARDRLRERPDGARVRRAHAEHVAASLRGGLPASGGGPWVAGVLRRFDDVRSACEWALDHHLPLALRLVAALADWVELQAQGEVEEWGRVAADRWAAAGNPADRPLAAAALGVAAGCARYRGDWAAVTSLAERGLALLGPDDPRRRLVTPPLGEWALTSGDFAGARRIGADLERWSALAGDPLRACYGRVITLLALAFGGDHPRAVAEARRYLAEADSPVAAAWAKFVLGVVLLEVEPDRAAALLRAAHADGAANGDRSLEGAALTNLAAVWAARGDLRRAVPLQRRVVEHWRRTGDLFRRWTAVRHSALLLAEAGELRVAHTLLTALHQRAPEGPVAAVGDIQRLAAVAERIAGELPAEEISALAAAGAAMADDAVLRLALDALSSVA